MLRKLHHIPLSELAVSKLNVRRHGAKDIDSLAASIAALGIGTVDLPQEADRPARPGHDRFCATSCRSRERTIRRSVLFRAHGIHSVRTTNCRTASGAQSVFCDFAIASYDRGRPGGERRACLAFSTLGYPC